MPQVIIREIDNTTAVASAYSNFSVVFPGPISADCAKNWNEVADENGVYECSSLSDFEKYIGKVADIEGQDIVKPTIDESKSYKKGDVIEASTYDNLIGADGIILELNSDERSYWFCTRTANKKKTEGGKLDDGTYIYKDAVATLDDFKAFFDDKTEEDVRTITVKNDLYCVTDQGQDYIEHACGNRLAYMLIALGYTVLFKTVNTITVGEDGSVAIDAPTASEIVEKLSDDDFWDCLRDRATYDFRYVISGGYYDTGIYAAIAKLVGRYSESANPADVSVVDELGRGDATALCDVAESELLDTASQSKTIASIKSWVNALSCFLVNDSNEVGKYCALFAPRVKIRVAADDVYGTDTSCIIPASIYYLACAAKASENYAEWYGVAGYQRGVSGYTVLGTTLTLGDSAVQQLEPRNNVGGLNRAVNVITKIKTLGNGGYYLWGSRTAYPLDSDELVASHFLNIRQLCTTLKKDIYVASKQLTFSPNDALLWIDFKDKIRPTLEAMKSDRGIKDYDIKKVTVKKRALVKAKIKIVPVEPVEDFDVGVYLEDSIDGTTEATIVEE